jgi:hypothetical protein
MSVMLKLQHEEGLRLRQQTAHKVERAGSIGDGDEKTGPIKSGTDWKFDKYQDSTGRVTEECPQDEDNRRVGPDGKKIKLGTYTVHVTANMRNLVVERKGKVKPFNFKNTAVRNQMRVQHQKLVETPRKKDGKTVHEWQNDGLPRYVAPNTFDGAFVGDGQRAVLDEMPT